MNIFDLESHHGPYYITYHYTEDVKIHEMVSDGFEDFSVSAKIQLIARILLKTNEVFEMSFSGEVFYSPDEKCYVIRFTKPGGKKICGLLTSGLMGKMTFGRTLELAIMELRRAVDYYFSYTCIGRKLGAKSIFQHD